MRRTRQFFIAAAAVAAVGVSLYAQAPIPEIPGRRLDNRGDIQQMRAQPATSEVRRPAAQLVAYGGSRAGSMREGAHPGRIAAYPAQELSLEATQA